MAAGTTENLARLARSAAPDLREALAPTPVGPLSVSGRRFLAKREDLQVTGSFKVRGALVKLSAMGPALAGRGVVCASAGNHGKGVAWAARRLGITATVVVPRGTPRTKKEGIAGLGAELIEMRDEPGYDAAEAWARRLARDRGASFVSPFDDPHVQAGGGGTIAIEIIEAVPDVRRVVVPVGGGGLATGLSAILHEHDPSIEIVGVQSAASPAMARSFRDGVAHLAWPAAETLAEGLEGGVAVGTFEACRRHVARIIEVSEESIAGAIARTAQEAGVTIEGSAATAVAAIVERSVEVDERTVVVLTGSNIDPERLASLVDKHD
jgi:threonine dehydratase